MRFRVFLVLFGRRMWLESFFMLEGIGHCFAQSENIRRQSIHVYDVGDRRLTKTNYFIYSSDNGDPVRELIKM